MIKYYISADLEGVCGTTNPLQCYPKDDMTGYANAVHQLTQEINLVAALLFEHDPTCQIVVNDAHNTMTNLPLGLLSPRIQLLSGKPKLCAMVAGLDETFDGAIFLGYHAKAGTENGILNHTFHSKLFDVQVNGVSYGEGGINALYSSLVCKVPVILAAGDTAFCDEIRQTLPKLVTVATKTGISTTAAQSVPLQQLQDAYRNSLIQMLQAQSRWSENLLSLKPPYTLRVTFINTLACDVVMTSPLYKRIDGRTVEMTVDNFKTLYQGLQSAYTMLAYTQYME